MDAFVGVNTPKLIVPSEFKVPNVYTRTGSQGERNGSGSAGAETPDSGPGVKLFRFQHNGVFVGDLGDVSQVVLRHSSDMYSLRLHEQVPGIS